ncbi:unnamed protein product [Colias eurytheme]|nr:unnamed protein product [Colias eurytheme]
MSLQRTRPIDTLQRIMSSFKHFEKKLDKLQDDVNFHGHTLTELRVMVANLSGGMLNSDLKHQDNIKRSPVKQTTAIQPDDQFNTENMPFKTKRKSLIQPLTGTKMQAKSFSGQKYGGKTSKEVHPFVNKLPSNPKTGLGSKRSGRHRKGEAPRKATTLRSQKEIVKKRSKVTKNIFS